MPRGTQLSSADVSCPSAPCAPGATVIGAVGEDGKIHHFKTAMIVDADFVERASRNGPPEKAMRFSDKCQTLDCENWDDERCGVVDRVMKLMQAPEAPPPEPDLPPCVIRATCRWYTQVGEEPCHICAYVITDAREVAAETSGK
ncbi:MAG: hypothetical protein GY952_19325 [Rhodobacteraceae bacterium]|nr:hypothetical protein [Paracoccaceae bacterium]